MTKKEIKIRQALADLLSTLGCGCCEDEEAANRHTETLATLLAVPMNKDKSGYDFSKFRSKP